MGNTAEDKQAAIFNRGYKCGVKEMKFKHSSEAKSCVSERKEQRGDGDESLDGENSFRWVNGWNAHHDECLARGAVEGIDRNEVRRMFDAYVGDNVTQLCADKFVERFCSKFSKPKELLSVEEEYYELLWAVSKKYPNETRHQTALRYIQQAEQGDGQGVATQLNARKGEK